LQVDALGREVGVTSLTLRGGVLTGEAAVDRGAQNQGMVVGDMVNTASRLQSPARPGTVLVGEATYLATNEQMTCAFLLPNTEAGTKAAHEARSVFAEIGALVLVQRLEELTKPQI